MLLFLVVCAGVLAILWGLDWLLYRTGSMARFESIQGPPRLPILGHSLDILTDRVKLFYVGRKESTEFEDCYKFVAPNLKIINIFSPEDIETVISTTKFNEKSMMYSILTPWLAEGLLLSSGSKWHSRRKILTPAFHFNILRHFCQILEENSWRLVKQLEKCSGLDKVDITPIVSEYTLQSICETAMGVKLDEQKSGAGQYYKRNIGKIVEIFIERFSKVWLLNDFIFKLSNLGKKQDKIIKEIKSFPRDVINERRKVHDIKDTHVDSEDSQKDDTIYMNKKSKMAMLDLLLTAEKQGLIDAEGIQEEVDTFMFEGHDTTAMGLVFSLMIIANHNEVQEKIVEELKGIFGDSERPASMAELQEMKYLECCIKESFRLYPPVPLISRCIGEDLKLKHCTVPAGTICHIQIFDLHRRADLFREPLQFKPERFMNQGGLEDSNHPFAYIPFSAGPRNCIGQKFAMLEMKSAISAVLRTYQLLPVTTPQDVIFTADLVLRPHNPIYVQFVKRK